MWSVKKLINSLNRSTFLRICSASFFSSMIQIYAIEGYKDFLFYFVGALTVLVVAHLLTHNKRCGWLIDCVALSAFFVVLGNFGFNSLMWVLWITLVGFVILRSKSDYKVFRVVLTNLILFVTLFSAVELPLRLSESSDDHPNINSGVDSKSGTFIDLTDKSYFRKALDLSKQDSTILSPNEEFLIVNKERIKASGDLVFLNDFPGSYIKIESGRRLTVGSTGLRPKRLLVFGGSTIFCAEVPDSMTVPSQLQQIANDNKFEIDVLNYGIPGIRIENQLRILETIGDLGPKDIVVFYDGINDLHTIFRYGLESNKTFIPLGATKRLVGWLEENSLLSRSLISGFIDSSGIGKDFLESDVEDKVLELWIKNDEVARSYVESKGAKFVHILQPNWVTFKGGTQATQDSKRWADMKAIQNYFEKYANPETKIENFSKKLDGLSSTPYIDWAHLDEIGNKKIAEEMFAVLEPLLSEQTK